MFGSLEGRAPEVQNNFPGACDSNEKLFFFEKKSQKTFAMMSSVDAIAETRKSFCFFFQKEALASLLS